MQEPQEISLGESYFANRFSGSKRQKVSCPDKFYFVSILDTLKCLLSHEEYQAEVRNPHQSNDKLGDFCDGTAYKVHPLFSNDPQGLQIIGYYDELEIINPLGSYVLKHKLSCLFFVLGNVMPKFRSTLKSIYLVAVGRNKDIEKYGIDEFLSPFVEDLKILYCDGIDVSIGGAVCTLHGGLLAFLADTLAAHTVGGFKKSMSFALRICRTCMTTTEQAQICFVERDFTLRTAETHFEQCELLSGTLCNHYSYGINRRSILEDVPGFSVINGLPHDVMHDIFEGVVPYELKLLLCHCVQQRYFTIGE